MSHIALLASTDNRVIDSILLGIVGVYEDAFPNRVRGYYVAGSHANGSAVNTSDIDLCIIFKDRFIDAAEEETARQIYKYISLISPIKIEIMLGPVAEEAVLRHHKVSMSIYLKMNSLLIFGEDIRNTFDFPSQEVYARAFMHSPLRRLAQVRILAPAHRERGFMVFPLGYPDPDGEFFGYDMPETDQDGTTHQSIGQSITNICSATMGIIALKTGLHIGSKADAIRIYREHINDEWADFLEELWQHGKLRWRYIVPEEPAERQHLRDLCRRVRDFENHYLSLYRNFLLAELANADTSDTLQAVKRLGLVVYPDDQILAALRTLDTTDQPELHKAVEQTLRRIETVRTEQGVQAAQSDDRHPFVPNSATWESYVGSYIDASKDARVAGNVSIENGQLFIYVQPIGEKAVCRPLDATRFECKYGLIEFHVAEDGSVPSVRVDLMIGISVTLVRVPEIVAA